MSLLQRVINEESKYIDITVYRDVRREALERIRLGIDISGMYEYALRNEVLVNNSAEDFALEFMNAYNNEIKADTY